MTKKQGWTRDPKNTKDGLQSLLTISCNQTECIKSYTLSKHAGSVSSCHGQQYSPADGHE